ncbi:hypothetical protein KORDIASMS9_03347 [Kordia sp. SMS9]|uniref:hypothetical protein n=1 Tax=Kordia sp. SMS9 TaxID=2282170 RepID=UPI000E0DFB1B|nr:hypothetical protein [Kordia sp. SMS9]AXG71092.1 hypothetical protein KORDIASMS9_03347 [Kordia sp. SMS9]
MAIFKKIQQKMDEATSILEIVGIVFKRFSIFFSAIEQFLKPIRFLIKLLRRILTRRIISIIRSIKAVLGRVARFAGPLKFAITVLENILGIFRKVLKPFENALKKLSAILKTFNQQLRLAKQSDEYQFLANNLGRILAKIKEINELVTLLEKQQEWIEKVFPAAFLNKIKAFTEALSAPMKAIKATSKKILKAIEKFLLKISGYAPIVATLTKNTEILEKWLQEVAKLSSTLLWIVRQIEIVIRRIPFLGYILDVLSYISGIIDAIIDASGIRDLLEYIVNNNAIITAVIQSINKLIDAIDDLIQDFKAILNDFISISNDLFNLYDILKNLHGLLKLIAAYKWFLEFHFPNILEKMREALKKLNDPDFLPLTSSDSSSLTFIVESVTIGGQGIGNDWVLNFTIGDETSALCVNNEDNNTIDAQHLIHQETVFNAQQTFQKSIHISATELDPVYNDYGGMETAEIIQIHTTQQEQHFTFSFEVNASGGDRGAKATITVNLTTVFTENENIVLPLSSVGAKNSGINHLEHAIYELRTKMGTMPFAPGLYANMNALDEFLNTSELLINKLKVLVVESPNDNEQKEKLIAEFYNLITSSQKQIIPERADQFEASYYMDLQNALEVVEKPIAETMDGFQEEEDDFCLCDELEISDFLESEIFDLPEEAQNFNIDAFLNSIDFGTSNEDVDS